MQQPAGLIEAIGNQGHWLYHRRSFVGVIILPVLLLAIWLPGFPGNGLHGSAFDYLGELGVLLSLCGLALRSFTVGWVPADTSVRSNRELRAAALNTTGMYSIVRHPLYLANGMTVAGLVVAIGSAWFFAVFALAYAIYVVRVAIAEENFIGGLYADQWHAWAARTPAFIPDVTLWQPSDLHFSLRTVLRREYNGVFGMTVMFFALEAVRNVLVEHTPWDVWITSDRIWISLLTGGVLTLLVLRTLKRHTHLLHVKGR